MKYFMIGLKGLGLGSSREAVETPMPRRLLKGNKLLGGPMAIGTLK